jgi:hypothetical protein
VSQTQEVKKRRRRQPDRSLKVYLNPGWNLFIRQGYRMVFTTNYQVHVDESVTAEKGGCLSPIGLQQVSKRPPTYTAIASTKIIRTGDICHIAGGRLSTNWQQCTNGQARTINGDMSN